MSLRGGVLTSAQGPRQSSDGKLVGVSAAEQSTFYVPTEADFAAGIRAYEQNESRGPVYFAALQQLNCCWGTPGTMADSIWILLKSWHREFYQYGRPNVSDITECVAKHLTTIDALRQRTIDSLCCQDEPLIERLFGSFTTATERHNARGAQKSDVATAKALHLLAPGFLPLWDNLIAYRYNQLPMRQRNYIAFCYQMKNLAALVRGYVANPDDRTLLKRIDEFNYSVYTKMWIRLPLR